MSAPTTLGGDAPDAVELQDSRLLFDAVQRYTLRYGIG